MQISSNLGNDRKEALTRFMQVICLPNTRKIILPSTFNCDLTLKKVLGMEERGANGDGLYNPRTLSVA